MGRRKLSEGQWSVCRFQYGRLVSGLEVSSNLVGGSMIGGRWDGGSVEDLSVIGGLLKLFSNHVISFC